MVEHAEPEPGHIERPEAMILPDSALVPDQCLIRPAPTAFTHELRTTQPFHYVGSDAASPADGALPVGTQVVLLDDLGEVCHVVDGRGLLVAISCRGLRPLP